MKKYISNILKVSELIEDQTQKDESNNYQNTPFFINLLALTNSEILSAQIFQIDENIIFSDPTTEIIENITQKQWFINATEDSTIHFFSKIIDKNFK